MVDTEVTLDPMEITDKMGCISVRVSIPFAKNCWFFESLGKDYNATSDVTLLTELVPMVQLTGLLELQKKSKGGGGGKGKVSL